MRFWTPRNVRFPKISAFTPTHIRYSGLLPSGYFAAFSLRSFFDLGPDEDKPQFRSELLRHLGLPPERLAWAQQVHGAQVLEVREPQYAAGADGLATNQPELFLTVAVADCLPIYLWSEAPPAVALLHAGWRGSAAGIAAEGVRVMKDKFGCDPRALGALLGPAICGSCYQVGPEVAHRFDASELLHIKDGELYLDLRRFNRRQLEESGVESRNILIDDMCTRCSPKLLFSYRRDGKGTGRMIAVLGMTNTGMDRKRN